MPNTEKLSSQRILVAQQMLAERNIDLAIITPGINYRYLTNQRAVALERLTALVITQSEYWLIVPELEFNQAREFHNEVEIISWRETDDPYLMVQARTPKSKVIVLDEKMPFFHVEKFQKVFRAEFRSFSPISEAMRSKKSDEEIQELTKVSAAINSVHLSIPEIKFANKTELAVANEIESMIRKGHETVDFVIVASGPNSANPHHQPGERVIQSGDVVVIDIGGTSKSGYCSDCTRTYVVDKADPEFVKAYEVLLLAQNLGVSGAKVGITAESLDKQVRDHLTSNNLGKWFVHRLGHGIGMETHETPWLVTGNKNLLDEGNVFSIEPGFYIPGKWGARVEDIVALFGSKTLNLNDFDHSLRIVH